MPRKNGNGKNSVGSNKKEIDRLKRLVKKQPLDINQDYNSGATGISSVFSILDESLRSEKPMCLLNTTLRATYEDPENDVNILRFIVFMYKCEVVSNVITPPDITDVLQANDVRAPLNFENRKKLRVISDRFYLQGGVSAGNTLNYNVPSMRYLHLHKKYGAGRQLKSTKDNNEVWHPFMLVKNHLDSSGTYFAYCISNIYTGGDQ